MQPIGRRFTAAESLSVSMWAHFFSERYRFVYLFSVSCCQVCSRTIPRWMSSANRWLLAKRTIHDLPEVVTLAAT